MNFVNYIDGIVIIVLDDDNQVVEINRKGKDLLNIEIGSSVELKFFNLRQLPTTLEELLKAVQLEQETSQQVPKYHDHIILDDNYDVVTFLWFCDTQMNSNNYSSGMAIIGLDIMAFSEALNIEVINIEGLRA